jgi:hypothetical protein
MRFFGWKGREPATAAAVLVATTAGLGSAPADAPATTSATREHCPGGATRLRPDAVAGATEAALARAARLYRQTNRRGARVTKAGRATADPDRGGCARSTSGRTVGACSAPPRCD